MEWSNELVFTLIEMYRNRPNLWDCKLKEYKDKNKRHDALMEIANHFKVEKSEIERKLKNLRSTFDREHNKVVVKKSGAGAEDVYKSKWFCYKHFLFLKDRNTVRGTTDTEVRNYLYYDNIY